MGTGAHPFPPHDPPRPPTTLSTVFPAPRPRQERCELPVLRCGRSGAAGGEVLGSSCREGEKPVRERGEEDCSRGEGGAWRGEFEKERDRGSLRPAPLRRKPEERHPGVTTSRGPTRSRSLLNSPTTSFTSFPSYGHPQRSMEKEPKPGTTTPAARRPSPGTHGTPAPRAPRPARQARTLRSAFSTRVCVGASVPE